MATGNAITCINLGTQSLNLATFVPTGSGGLTLTGYHSTQLLADPNAETSHIPQLRLGLRDLATQSGTKGRPVNYCLRGEAVFSRFVRLPRLDSSKVQQIVTFEAQQNIPFPLKEVVWDYQLVQRGQEAEMEVVLVAIKKDLLNDVNEAVEDAGLETELVDIAPMALLNAFRFNYYDVDQCSLVIDVGARSTNLAFSEPGLIWLRSFRLGGNDITQAVSREFKEDFAAAEERKKRDGFVHLGGAYEEPEDPEIATLGKVIRNAMTRFHTEISRSINFYRSQQKGSKPERIYLAGSGSSLPYMTEFFSEKFQVTCEYFNPLRNVKLGKNVPQDELLAQPYTLGELVGVALRQTGPCPMEINLQPDAVAARKELGSRRPFFIAASICLLLALGGYWFFLTQGKKKAEAELADLQPKVAEFERYAQQIRGAQSELDRLERLAAPYLRASEQPGYWARVFEDLNSHLPAEGIWLTSVTPAHGENPLLPEDNQAIASLLEEEKPASAQPGRRGVESEEEQGVFVEALLVEGLVLEGSERKVDLEFLPALQRDSEIFNVTKEDEDEIIVTPVQQSQKRDRFAMQFRLRLPLKDKLRLE